MRRKLALLVASLLVAGGTGAASIIASSSATAATTITVTEHAVTDHFTDLGKSDISPGDLLTFHNELFDAGNENVVGTDQGECVRIEVGVSWECRWINFLEGGSSTVEGPFSMRDPRRWPSPEARECIEERAGACVSCLVTRPGRSSTSSSGS